MSDKLIPGKYSAEAMGVTGPIRVTIRVGRRIEDVKIDAHYESVSFGQAAAPKLRREILQQQSADIDAVSGATVTSNAVKSAVAADLKQAKRRPKPFSRLFTVLYGKSGSTEVELMVKDGRVSRASLYRSAFSGSQAAEARRLCREIEDRQRLPRPQDRVQEEVVRAAASALTRGGAKLSEWYDAAKGVS